MKKRIFTYLSVLVVMVAALIVLFALSTSAYAADTVATVTAGKTTTEYTALADAFAAAGQAQNSTLALQKSIKNTDELDVSGTYTFNLNGQTLTTATLTVKSGTVTVVDHSAASNGAMICVEGSVWQLVGGNLTLKNGSYIAKRGYTIENLGTGIVTLIGDVNLSYGTPGKANILLKFADTLDVTKFSTVRYFSVQLGWDFESGQIVARGGENKRMAVNNYDVTKYVMIGDDEGNLITQGYAFWMWGAVALLFLLGIAIIWFTISRVRANREKLYSFSLPALFFTALFYVRIRQRYALAIAGAFCLIALFHSIMILHRQKKQIKAKQAERDERAALAARYAGGNVTNITNNTTTIINQQQKTDAQIAAEEADVRRAARTAELAEATEESVAEETVEDAVEEAEETVEEAVAEEVVAEEADDEADEDGEEDEEDADKTTITAVPHVAGSSHDTVLVAETDENGAVKFSTYKRSFKARLIQSAENSDDVQSYYETVKNALLSYKKVSARMSWNYESFKNGRNQLAKFSIRGKTLCLFLAMDPASLENTKYNVKDVSDQKKYAEVPCRLRLTSGRSVKWALELIAKLAEEKQLVANPKFEAQAYRLPFEKTEALIEQGLIKKPR